MRPKELDPQPRLRLGFQKPKLIKEKGPESNYQLSCNLKPKKLFCLLDNNIRFKTNKTLVLNILYIIHVSNIIYGYVLRCFEINCQSNENKENKN